MPSPALILVIEDHADSREMLVETLELEGFRVEWAENGRDGLARLRKGPLPDLVVLDLMMPVMTGWELMEHVRADPALAAVPVLVTSGAGASRPLPEGIRRAIPKPIDLDVLLEEIRKVLPGMDGGGDGDGGGGGG